MNLKGQLTFGKQQLVLNSAKNKFEHNEEEKINEINNNEEIKSLNSSTISNQTLPLSSAETGFSSKRNSNEFNNAYNNNYSLSKNSFDAPRLSLLRLPKLESFTDDWAFNLTYADAAAIGPKILENSVHSEFAGSMLANLITNLTVNSDYTFWEITLYSEESGDGLLNSDGDSVVYIQGDSRRNITSTWKSLPAGTYYIKVEDNSYNNDDYKLKIS